MKELNGKPVKVITNYHKVSRGILEINYALKIIHFFTKEDDLRSIYSGEGNTYSLLDTDKVLPLSKIESVFYNAEYYANKIRP